MIAAVVIAAGLGTRLRPLTERWPKPVLPIHGKPVLAQLLRELGDAGCPHVTVVSGHLAEQVERLAGDGSSFGLRLDHVRQETPDGSAHAVAAARPTAPYLVLGADQVYEPGELAAFSDAFERSGADGAVAVQEGPGPVAIEDGVVTRIPGEGRAAAPLWAVGPGVAPHVAALPGAPPYELARAFQDAIDAGKRVVAVEIGPSLDLTTPADLLEHNFPYLGSL